MSKRFRVSTAVIAKLDELGIRPAAVFRRAGLPITLLEQPRIHVATEEFFALFHAIADLSDDPTIGLRLGSEDRIERYDPIAIAALYTPSLGDALDKMSRYKRLTCPEELRVRRAGNECHIQFLWTMAESAEPPVLTDLCFAWVLSIARRGTGATVPPLRVELARRPSNRAALKEHFGCPVQFDAPANTLVLRAADLERPFITHNAELLAMIAPRLEEELREQRAQVPFPEHVRTIVKRQLAGQRPSIQGIARELNMSARTLQRRLTESSASFQQILEQARRELARHYLIHSDLELHDTAYLLGYEDTNSFVRAFHAWEGLPPGLWRDTQRGVSGDVCL